MELKKEGSIINDRFLQIINRLVANMVGLTQEEYKDIFEEIK